MRGERTRALWRVRPYLRPYVSQLATMVVLSLMAIGAALVVPMVMRRIVDGPIARGDRGAVLPLAVLVLVLGLVERPEHYRAPRPPEYACYRAGAGASLPASGRTELGASSASGHRRMAILS